MDAGELGAVFQAANRNISVSLPDGACDELEALSFNDLLARLQTCVAEQRQPKVVVGQGGGAAAVVLAPLLTRNPPPLCVCVQMSSFSNSEGAIRRAQFGGRTPLPL